jgi:hypothetical protein
VRKLSRKYSTNFHNSKQKTSFTVSLNFPNKDKTRGSFSRRMTSKFLSQTASGANPGVLKEDLCLGFCPGLFVQ